MSSPIMIVGMAIAIALEILILIFILRKSSGRSDKDIQGLRDKILTFETTIKAKLEDYPELINARIADIIQRRFSTFTETILEKNQDLVQKFGNFQTDLTKAIAESSKNLSQDFNNFKDLFKKDLNDDFEKLNRTVENKLEHINQKVQQNLSEGFKKTNETFNDVIQRLAKIDEAQKKIESLSINVVSLQDILTDKKSRGVFGEVQLNQILFSVFGERNEKVFQTQHKLSNGSIADAILFAPDPTGDVAIDSKFPLENYRKMMDRTLSEIERAQASKLFDTDVRKHIDDIAAKYIIPGETSNQAVMFLPAEAVFAELYAYHENLVNYAQRKRVWITSPTTFMAVLNTLQIVLNDIERKKFAHIIQQELIKLSEDFRRYRDRWDKLSIHIDTVQKDVKDIHTTTKKISTSFEKIANVEIDEEPRIEENDQQLLESNI